MPPMHPSPFHYTFPVADTPFVFFVLSEFPRIGDTLDFEINREVEGEREERMRARLERHQRTRDIIIEPSLR